MRLTKLQRKIIETVKAAGSVKKQQLKVDGKSVERLLLPLSRLIKADYIVATNTDGGVILSYRGKE